MPGKTSKSGQNGDKVVSPGMPSFVRCELSDTHRKAVREALLSPEDAVSSVETLALLGIKVSISFESQNDAFGAYATGGQSSSDCFKGLCLTARGPSVIGAVTALMFKHQEILGEDWRTAAAWSKDEKWS